MTILPEYRGLHAALPQDPVQAAEVDHHNVRDDFRDDLRMSANRGKITTNTHAIRIRTHLILTKQPVSELQCSGDVSRWIRVHQQNVSAPFAKTWRESALEQRREPRIEC